MLSKRLKADLLLFLVAVIWGSAFVAQRVAAPQSGIFLFNGARFLIGLLVLLPFLLLHKPRGVGITRQDCLRILLVSLVLLGGSVFQQWGLRFTTAANAGFITGLYVVLTPLFLALGLRRLPRPVVILAALLATAGMFLLSTGGKFAWNAGDGLELVGAVFWAMHVILVGRFVQRIPGLYIAAGQSLVCGVLGTAAGLVFEADLGPGLLRSWPSVLYVGIFSTGVAYTLQILGQKEAPPSDAAIIMSTEAAFAALSGWLILDERLAGVQLLGCVIMFIGMIAVQIDGLKNGAKSGLKSSLISEAGDKEGVGTKTGFEAGS
jgi:drug/metabolite transporter (DMT)-like permease